jgi:hypothetical protein
MVKIKKQNLTRLASISALGAGAMAISAKNAHAGIVYTSFSQPVNTVGLSSSAFSSFGVNPVVAGGFGGFNLFTTRDLLGPYFFGPHSSFSATLFFKIALKGLDGLRFQSAPGPGFIWNNTAPTFTGKILRSKRFFTRYTVTSRKYTPATNGKATTTTQFFPHSFPSSQVLLDRLGDFYMLFTFNPTGSQDLYGWIHLNGHCNCGLDTEVVAMAYEDSGAFIEAGASPEPATAIPTGLAALALGATGLRRWRKSRKQAA